MPLREISLQPSFLRTAPSCLVTYGGTRVLCTATAQDGVPPFLRGKESGWLTAEYAMLPASTGARKARDGIKKDGRGVEISRLIGRSLRQAVDLRKLGDRTVTIDCDVLEADGGTRCAAITGGFVALVLLVDGLMQKSLLAESPIARQIAAVSVGVVEGSAVLDLCYAQDSRADVDMNVVMDGEGRFVEVQGTGEDKPFERRHLDELLDLATEGIKALMRLQREALGSAAQWIRSKLPRLVLATNNQHKVRELKALLHGVYDAVSLAEAGVSIDIEETGATFAENATLKAEAVSRLTGLPALADDSGLMVDALDGAPGVFSARYAGLHGDDAANNRLLLLNLHGKKRPLTARFVSAIALASPGREMLVVEGSVEGKIIDTPRGEGGFGYDPLFEYENGETFAEMSDELKNTVSHRARAAKALQEALLDSKTR